MMKQVTSLNTMSVIVILVILCCFQESSLVAVEAARPLVYSSSRPLPTDAAPFARWLVSHSSWGVLKYVPVYFSPFFSRI